MIELIRFDGWINNFEISNLVRIFSIYPWGSMGMIFLLLVAFQTAYQPSKDKTDGPND